jgi:hypothetical protein
LGAKAKDFEDFKEASVLIKSKAHLTKEPARARAGAHRRG